MTILPILRFLLICLLCAACPARAEVGSGLFDGPLQISPEIRPPAIPGPPAPDSFVVVPPALQIPEELPRMATIDLTRTETDLWQRMRNGFSMPDLDTSLVADRQAWYLNRPDMLKRIFQRSRRYLFHIVEELEKRGMPTELALLPIVESSFNPLALSPAKALGIWQFIPSTGKNYKLAQNWWLDERRDILASTSAALDYLQNIYEMHGDWHLALASYNWGEYAVAKAVARNQAKGLPTDYASLSMPGETRYYVPKLQALKNIVADPALFGVQIDPIPNKPYFGTIDLWENMDIATAAKLAETPLDEFIALNPAYHRPVIPGEGRNPLVVPAEKVQVFMANLHRHELEEKPLSNWKTYSLRKGEKLEAVATRHGLTVVRLKQLNGITPKTRIGAGHVFLVPAGAQAHDDLAIARLPQDPVEAKVPRAVKARAVSGRTGRRGSVVTAGAGGRQRLTLAAGKSRPGGARTAAKGAPQRSGRPAARPAPKPPKKKR